MKEWFLIIENNEGKTLATLPTDSPVPHAGDSIHFRHANAKLRTRTIVSLVEYDYVFKIIKIITI